MKQTKNTCITSTSQAATGLEEDGLVSQSSLRVKICGDDVMMLAASSRHRFTDVALLPDPVLMQHYSRPRSRRGRWLTEPHAMLLALDDASSFHPRCYARRPCVCDRKRHRRLRALSQAHLLLDAFWEWETSATTLHEIPSRRGEEETIVRRRL